MSEEKDCPLCGLALGEGSGFCTGCGYDFSSAEKMEEGRVNGYLEEDIESFVQKNGQSYVEKFRRLEASRPSFNWCALLFTSEWFAYRRLYGWAAGTILLGILLGIGTAMAALPFLLDGRISMEMFSLLALAVGFLLRVACGFFGDGIYWRRVKKTLEEDGCKGRAPLPDSKRSERLAQVGRPSVAAVVVALVCGQVFTQLITTFVTPTITGWLMGIL